MAYKVKIEGSDADFYFINVDDSLNFASMAAEYGSIEDYHYEKNTSGEHIRISDGWRPVAVTFEKVAEVSNE